MLRIVAGGLRVMIRFTSSFLIGLLLAAGCLRASVMLASPADLNANDASGWHGTDQQLLGGNAFQAISEAGMAFNVAWNATTASFATVCPATPCSWTNAGPGLNSGDLLLWMSHTGNVDGGAGPLILSFPNAVSGVVWIQTPSSGQFTAQVLVANAALKIGTFSVTSDSAGDPVFLGVIDDMPEITEVFYSLTAAGVGEDLNNFAVDTVFLNDSFGITAPEPTTFLFLGSGLGILYLWRLLSAHPHAPFWNRTCSSRAV